MRKAALIVILVAAFAVLTDAQKQTLRNIEPAYPAGADDLIYGDIVPVIVSVDPVGKVTNAITLGPHVPCSKRDDKTAKAITEAVLAAARATVFAPTIKNGVATNAAFLVSYKLPIKTPVSRVDKKTFKLKLPYAYPEFPEEARRKGLEGGSEVSILVDESGKVISAAPRSGAPEFLAAAIDAACRTRFEKIPVKTLTTTEFLWRRN